MRREAGCRRVHIRDITSNNVKHRISNHHAAGRCRSSARDDSYCPLDAEKTPSCSSKQSCCIETHDQRANHKRCWPSTRTHLKHAMPGCATIIPQWDRKPQLTRRWLDAISAGSSCCAQRQRSGVPLRDTRRALCHVVRRFWQTRYRLVWEPGLKLNSIGSGCNLKSDVLEDKQRPRHGSRWILPGWWSATSLEHG